MSPPIPSHSGATPAATDMEDAAAGGGNFAVTTPAPEPTCPVCMESWTCNGDHRICCIPCGHVYGRSCLERWLHRCGDDSAKCPQCGEQFEDKLIINLYAPGNLWDGCCRLQELKEHYESEIHEVATHFKTMMAENEAERRAQRDAYNAMREDMRYQRAYQDYHNTFMIAMHSHFTQGTPMPVWAPPPLHAPVPSLPPMGSASGTPGSAASNQHLGGGGSTPAS